MAVQRQPAYGGNPSNAGGSSDTQSVDFRDGSVITGGVKAPDDTITALQSSKSSTAWNINDAAELRDANDDGNTGKGVVTLIRWMIDKVKEFLGQENSTGFGNQFAITYHNHDFPVPIPLTPFITELNIAETHMPPYNKSSIRLKIPFEHIQVMFRNAGGRIDAGGYVSIRQKSAPTLDDPIDNPRVKSSFFLTHLLLIDNISYGMSVDQESGNILTNIELSLSSFITPLIEGQYVVSETTSQAVATDDPRFKVAQDELNRRLDALGVPEDSPRRTFARLTTTSRTIAGSSGNLADEFFFDGELYNKFLQLVCDGSVIRKHSGKDLTDVLRFLGYPKLPTSLTSAYVLEKWVADIEKELDKGAVQYIRLLRTQGVAEDKIQEIGKSILEVFDNVTRNTPNSAGVFKDRATSGKPTQTTVGPFAFQTSTASAGDTTVAAELLAQELGQNNKLNVSGELSEGIEQRIGDVIRVITCTQDLPAGLTNEDIQQLPWYSSLADEPLFNENLNKIGNLYSKGQTIWGACISTFQPDSKTHEMFPVVIPIMNDKWFAYANKYERNLGGILAIIYRKKPMHPYVNVNSKSINEEYRQYRDAFSSKVDEPYYKSLEYYTDSELLGVNQEKQAGLDEIYQQNSRFNQVKSGDRSKEYYLKSKSIPSVPYRDVIDMSFNHANTLRVNGIQVMHPYSQHSAEGIDILQKPYINIADASRHGLRFYQTNYPFLSVTHKEQGALNEGNATAERLYMTLGDGSKYSQGEIKIYLETTYGIKQGCWFALDFSDKAALGFENVKNNRLSLFIAYCDVITYEFETDQRTGNIRTYSNISYSRGSWGGIIPELPATQISFQSKEEEGRVIASTGDQRVVQETPGEGRTRTQRQSVDTTATVRYAEDEWGYYSDVGAQQRRDDAFGQAWGGLSTAQQTTTSTAEGENPGDTYFDIDGDGEYEWYVNGTTGNTIYIPGDRRPKAESNGVIFESIEDIVGPGFVAPYPPGYTGTIYTVANINDDYSF